MFWKWRFHYSIHGRRVAYQKCKFSFTLEISLFSNSSHKRVHLRDLQNLPIPNQQRSLIVSSIMLYNNRSNDKELYNNILTTKLQDANVIEKGKQLSETVCEIFWTLSREVKFPLFEKEGERKEKNSSKRSFSLPFISPSKRYWLSSRFRIRKSILNSELGRI